MHDFTTSAIIRTLAFHAAWRYAPTRTQLLLSLDTGPEPLEPAMRADAERCFDTALARSLDLQILVQRDGRLCLASHADQIEAGRELEAFYPRKLKKAKRIAAYLRRLPWARAVFLCNTTALGQARDASDLDFFIIAKAGSIWRMRLASAMPFMLFKSRPSEGKAADPVCLSFFITERALDLSLLALEGGDPYLRHWFLSLLPLYDDGILPLFWQANQILRMRHPFARPWIALDAPGVLLQAIPDVTLPAPLSLPPSERICRFIQHSRFPRAIRTAANRDTGVVIRDDVLKFHVEDRRREYKDRYEAICRQYDVTP